jgi:uncharacterized membrane protein YkvA (DUF1232 family)
MKLIRLLPFLFTRFRRELKMVWGILTHPQAPATSKFMVVLAILYLISPADFVPDFIPVLGWLDDVGVLGLLIGLAYKLLPRELYESLRQRVDGVREPQTIDVTPQK